MKYKISPAYPYPLGVRRVGLELYASMISETEDCGILLYSGKKTLRIPFPKEQHIGQVYSMKVEEVPLSFKEYQLYQGDQVLADPYGTCYKGYPYGDVKEPAGLVGVLIEDDTNTGERPAVRFSDSVYYGLHVRGFTMHESSGCKHRGTFTGVREKLGYLKELGVTSIILMPSYEFVELEPVVNKGSKAPVLNYWGFKKGYYYAPKASYTSGKNPVKEFKQLVKSCHDQGMELLMQFYFPEEVSSAEALRVLEYWVATYQVDGFQVMTGDTGTIAAIWSSPILAATKLIFRDFPEELLRSRKSMSRGKAFGGTLAERASGSIQAAVQKRVCICQDHILQDYRRFIKGDTYMAEAVMYYFGRNDTEKAYLNRIADYDSFRLADVVSYNHKHNEANGEGNTDGTDYNASWNCGVEGATEEPRIQALRLQQMKNALTLILLSQGTPYLFMGDERGFSQQGNNNPYNQDNEISWLDWSELRVQQELYEFTKALIAYRKANPFLHTEEVLDGRDYLGQGYPNIAFHGQEAYQVKTDEDCKELGIALCGEDLDGACRLVYLACNMHWLPRKLALPRVKDGKDWKLVMKTNKEDIVLTRNSHVELPARTIAVLEVQLTEPGKREENQITAF